MSKNTVMVCTQIRGAAVVAYIAGYECPAEPDVGIMSAGFDPSHVESVEVDGEDEEAAGLFPLSDAEEQRLCDLAAEEWEPEEYDDHDAAYDSWKERDL